MLLPDLPIKLAVMKPEVGSPTFFCAQLEARMMTGPFNQAAAHPATCFFQRSCTWPFKLHFTIKQLQRYLSSSAAMKTHVMQLEKHMSCSSRHTCHALALR